MLKVPSLLLVNSAWVDIHEIWRKYTFEIATARSLTTSHSLLLQVDLKRFSKVRVVTLTSMMAALRTRRHCARAWL